MNFFILVVGGVSYGVYYLVTSPLWSLLIPFLLLLYLFYKLFEEHKEQGRVTRGLSSEYKHKLPEINKLTISDFWLNMSERSEFKNLNSLYNKMEVEYKNLVESCEENNIKKNKDGSYSRRSNLGKELADAIDDVSEKITGLKNNIKNLAQKPVNRRGVLFYSLRCLYESISKTKSLRNSMSFLISIAIFFKLFLGQTELNNFLFVLFSLIFPCGSYFFSLFIYKMRDEKCLASIPNVPEVTIKNIDEY